jgi:hypothetical protein
MIGVVEWWREAVIIVLTHRISAFSSSVLGIK